MAPVLRADNLSKSFGKQPVIENLSLCIEEGDVYGLVGLNGAGKTTLIRLLLGILKPDSGKVTILNRDPWSHNASLCRSFGVVLEHDGFWGNLNFEQNMRIFAAAKGVAWPGACRYLEEHWSGTALYKSKKAVKYYSRGQRVQCAICRAFLGSPSVFFFDEPVVALDVEAYEHFNALVRGARARGAAFIVSSHQLDAIDDLCNRVGVLRDRRVAELSGKGRNSKSGPIWELCADPNARWASIIIEVCGSAAEFRNDCWQFAVLDPDAMIPALIAKLAGAGCLVRSIAPAASGFRDVIRSECRDQAVPLKEARP